MAGNAKSGRRPKLTPEIQKTIIDRVAAGIPRKFAAMAAGIEEKTIYLWQRRGAKEKKGIYVHFLHAIKKAEADAVARNVAIVQKAASKTWTAAAWWLERRHPEEFGRAEIPRDNGRDGAAGRVSVEIKETVVDARNQVGKAPAVGPSAEDKDASG